MADFELETNWVTHPIMQAARSQLGYEPNVLLKPYEAGFLSGVQFALKAAYEEELAKTQMGRRISYLLRAPAGTVVRWDHNGCLFERGPIRHLDQWSTPGSDRPSPSEHVGRFVIDVLWPRGEAAI